MMEKASAYLQARLGETAFAVVDSRGHEFGLNMHRTFVSASVVKAMLLVAYLRALGNQHGSLGYVSQSLLYPMIHVSDNKAASAVWQRVGDSELEDVARAARMTDFALGSDWANEEISAADQARFFYHMDSLIPRQFRSYARELLAGVDPTESWGIPAAAGPQWQVYFKGGWRRTGTGQLVSQVARLEQRKRRIAIAVMTATDPSMAYGEETIDGVTARLLGGGAAPSEPS
jgi:beta-lactamase class A